MRRRLGRKAVQSSFDLFLDTICNAFGGIMFIAILVSILLQMKGIEPPQPDSEGELTESQAAQLQSRMEQLQTKVEQQLISNMDREKHLMSETTLEVRQLQNQRDAAMAKLKELQQNERDLLHENATRDSNMRELREELSELTQRLNSARIAVSERSKDLKDSLDAIETTATLPKVSATLKGNLLMAIRYGKLYLISDMSRVSSHGMNEQHADVTTGLTGTTVRLKPNAGWSLESDEGQIAMSNIMSSNPSSTTFFSIAVWPDSFEAFSRWKEIAVKNGYDYDLTPIDDVDVLFVGKSSSATVQ